MDITSDNFSTSVDDIVRCVSTCDYYAFDLEMTGINFAALPEDPENAPDDIYRIKRAVASRFNIIQVGLCTFHREAPPARRQRTSASLLPARSLSVTDGATSPSQPPQYASRLTASAYCARPLSFRLSSSRCCHRT
jgi:hypothetical protein